MANATHAVDDLFSPNSKYKVDFQSVVEERRDSREKNKQDIAVDEDDEKKKSKSKESEVRFGSKKRKQLEEGIEEDDSDTDESKSTTDDGSSEEEDNALEQVISSDKEDIEKTIFVGNVSSKTSKKALKGHFQKYGNIESIRFRSVPLKNDTKVPRRVAAASGALEEEKGSVHAYIVYETKESVPRALQENMKTLDGRHLRVDRATVNMMRVKMVGAKKGGRAAAEILSTAQKVQYDESRTIFVGNVPLDVDDEDLIRFFIAGLGTGGDGLIEAVRIVRDPKTLKGKGIAFVMLKSRATWRLALKLDGKKLQGRALRISPAQSHPHSSTSAQGSLKRTKKTETWQGATATKSGRVRGAVHKNPLNNKGVGRQPNPLHKKRTGKRPAVAARKLQQKMSKS